MFVNDTWRVNQHRSLNAGVRYEYTTTPTGENRQTLNAISNTPSILVPQAGNQPLVFGKVQPAKNNWAPRIGFAYSPGSSGNTSIRAGFGLAYDSLYDNIGSLSVPPQIGSTENVKCSRIAYAPNVTPLTPGFLSAAACRLGGGSGITILEQGNDAIANTANWLPNKELDPYSINWNIGVQHAFGKNYSAEINYVGTRGVHLPLQDIINLATISYSRERPADLHCKPPSQATPRCSAGTLVEYGPRLALQNANIVPASTRYANAGFNNASGNSQPNGTFGPPCTPFITAFVPRGQSSYNGLQAGLSRRFSNGLTFQSAYTWSHTIDNSTADFHTTDITPRRPQVISSTSLRNGRTRLSTGLSGFTLAMYSMSFAVLLRAVTG